MNRGRATQLMLVVALQVLSGCGGDGTQTTDDMVASDPSGLDDLAGPTPPFDGLCPLDFGLKTPGELAALVGKVVVLEGRVIAGQPIKVAPQECVGLGGLNAIHLRTKNGGSWKDDVQIRTADGEAIFCGCPLAQGEECQDFPPGARMRLKGVLEANPSIAPGDSCNQESCYAITPQARCHPDGCDHDDHCPLGTCNKEAFQCRGQAGGTCDREVGCDPKDGAPHFCVDATPNDPLTDERLCKPVGDGSEDSVCGTDTDCTQCPDCECMQHVCVFVVPMG